MSFFFSSSQIVVALHSKQINVYETKKATGSQSVMLIYSAIQGCQIFSIRITKLFEAEFIGPKRVVSNKKKKNFIEIRAKDLANFMK